VSRYSTGNRPEDKRVDAQDAGDAAAVFRELVAARSLNQVGRAQALTAQLRRLGWSVVPIAPKVGR
jgi:hypothetical protein